MSEADTSPPATKQEKITSAVAPSSAAVADDSQPHSDKADNGLISADNKVPTAKFALTEKALDVAFNDMWANNANAISHCYSNTDALKVDFTRTGKRSFLGMINDATNSVYRMVQGAVTDFFRQTVLDFTYGSIGLHGLERYYDDLNSRDPSESIRLARVRASAIDSCRREVVPESEEVIGEWTLCSPLQANTVQALKLEEKVALLTARALYVCSYDFGSEKLNEFTKVLVGDIVGIQEGMSTTIWAACSWFIYFMLTIVFSFPPCVDLAPDRSLRHFAPRVLSSRRQLGFCRYLSQRHLTKQHHRFYQKHDHHHWRRNYCHLGSRYRIYPAYLCLPCHLGRHRRSNLAFQRQHSGTFEAPASHGQRPSI